jgi:heat shock protein HslJ
MPARSLAPRILSVLAALAPAIAAAPAAARDISGSLTSLPPIALPADAEIMVEVWGRDGLVAETRVPTEGRQVPLAFALAGLPEGPLLLRGAIADRGGVQWLSEPVPVAPGADDLDLGLLTVQPHQPAGFVTTWACGPEVVRAGFSEMEVVVSRGPEARVLPSVPAASGAKFADGAPDETSFWTKGDTATVVWSGGELPPCRRFALPTDAAFVASGNEPFWLLELSEAGMRLTTPEGEEPGAGALPPAVIGTDRVVYPIPGGPIVTLWPQGCNDSMTGMPYPVTVALDDGTEEGRRMGCGGDPAVLLAGRWTVTAIDGEAVPEGVEVTMTFDGDRVDGSAGCNRYTGGYSLTGEGLSFGPAAGTRMACPEPQMATEAAFYAALQAVDRFDIDAEGGLILLGADIPLIAARR